ncbi:MAG TPA: hypothetical protein VMW26_05635 [Methanomassiliicoccales archaeon]|nr:hypothetical protein [Methanomassiliicoccales archaeon]
MIHQDGGQPILESYFGRVMIHLIDHMLALCTAYFFSGLKSRQKHIFWISRFRSFLSTYGRGCTVQSCFLSSDDLIE